ncbi:MAG: hypothetical protein ACIAQZ_10325 [Sedimentisphaeraceae bacterium JB056]
MKKSIRIGHNDRLTINTVLAGLAADPSEEDAQWCSEVIADLLEDNVDDFSKSENSHGLYWALPQLSMILASPEISPRLSERAEQILKALLWDFVYTYDDLSRMDNIPEDLLNVYISDNHDVHKKGVFLLAAQIFKNDPDYADRKYTDGTTAERHYQVFVDYFMAYYKYRAQRGIDIEFGSAVYSGVHLQPLFAMYDCIENKQLKEYTRRFIDLFFADVAQETINGIRGGAKVRMYKDPSTYKGENDKLMFCNYMLTGQPETLNKGISFDSIIIAASNYELPDVIYNLITEPEKRGNYSYISRRLGQGDHVLYTEHEYHNAPMYVIEYPSSVYRYSWCSPDYVLGWFAIDESKHYMLINSQNQWMGVVTGESVNSRIVFQTTSPELMARRASYRNLMAIGDKNAMVIRRQLASYGDELLFTFVSNDFSLEEDKESGWIFGHNSKTYYAIKPAVKDEGGENGIDVSEKPKYVIAEKEGYDGKFVKYLNPSVMVVFEVAGVKDYTDFESFKKDMRDNEMQYVNNFDQFEYFPSRDAAKLTMFADMKKPCIDDVPLNFTPNQTYKSPYIYGDYDSNKVTVKDFDGNKLILDFGY